MTLSIREVFGITDWKELRLQKQHLVDLSQNPCAHPSMCLLEGLISFLDFVQDAAELEGYPVFGNKQKHTKVRSRL